MEQNHMISNESIKESLKTLTSAYIGLKEATNLLTCSHKTAGQWGEVQLIRLLEYTGLLQYCEFEKQVYMESNEGAVLKPDVVVILPDNISIAIDAKTSFISYAKLQQSITNEDKKKYQKEYYKNIKAHITSLGSKKYWSQFKNSPEMVIMFLPGENFWQTALEEDGDIIEYAYNMNVVVATPLTLIPLLRIIASIWSKFQISQDSEDLRKRCIFLYETLVKLSNSIYDFGRNLDASQKTYNKILALERDVKQPLEKFRELYFPLLAPLKIFQEDI
jgi:DNA recombination protein RmuC